MKTEIGDLVERRKRRVYSDGTGEMAFGIMAVGYTLLGYLQAVMPKDSIWHQGTGSMVFFFAFIGAMCGLIYWAPKLIQKKFAWPRTGYVKFRGDLGGGEKGRGVLRRKFRHAWTLVVAAIAAAIGAGVVMLKRWDGSHDWLGLLWLGNVGVFVAAYGFWVYRFDRRHPWKWLVLLGMALGLLAIALLAPGEITAMRWLMLGFVGLMWLASGGITLLLFIRNNEPSASETE